MLKKILNFLNSNKIIIGIIVGFSILYSLISLLSHYNLHTNAWDLGIFNKSLYQYAHLELGPNNIRELPNLLGDHFEFLMVLLAPLYYIFGSYTLLIVQIAAIIIGALGIYRLIQYKTKSNVLSILALIFILSFFGTIQAIAFDYHNDALGFAVLSWMLLSIERKKINKYYLFLLLFLLTKETMAIVAIFVGLSMLIFDKKDGKHGLLTIFISIIYYLAATKILIPYFSEGIPYAYWYYKQLGIGTLDAIKNIAINPLILINLLVNDPIKIKTLRAILLSGGIFLFLKPKYGIIFLPFLLMKLYATPPRLWETSFQYLLVAGIPLTLAIFTFLGTHYHKKKVILIITLFTLLISIVVTYKTSIYNANKLSGLIIFNLQEIWSKNDNRQAFREAKKILPDDKKVCCQSNLCSHMENKNIYNLFPYTPNKCDYLIINKEISFRNDLVIADVNLDIEAEFEALKKCRKNPRCDWLRANSFNKDFQLKRLDDKINDICQEEGFVKIFDKKSVMIYEKTN